MAAKRGSVIDVREECQTGKCGVCKKAVMKADKGIMCDLCETWFHCKCQDMADDTYKLMNQDKIHFYCGGCDKVVGKILKALTDMNVRQDKMEEKITKIESELFKQVNDKNVVKKKDMEEEMRKVRLELKEVRDSVKGDSSLVLRDEERIEKLHKEVGEMRMNVREEVEEKLEIERRKRNLVIHGVPETDAEQDIDTFAEIIGEGLHMDFDRHIETLMRIGRLVEGKPRPLRVVVKTLDGRKEILARAKNLKDNDKFKRMFISPDLTRKQQEADRDLRNNLKRIREEGETEAKIKFGRIVKNMRGGREEVLYQPVRQM